MIKTAQDIIIAPVDDDYFRTTVTVAVSRHFFGWLMSLDGYVRIVAPANVVEEMKETIEEMAEQYEM